MENQGRMPLRAEIKQAARARIAERRGACIGVLFLSWLVTVAASLLTAFLLRTIARGNVSQVVVTVFSLPIGLFSMTINVEIIYFFLTVYRGEQVTVGAFFSTLWRNVGRKIGGMLWLSMFIFLWALAAIVPIFIILAAAGSRMDSDSGSIVLVSLLMLMMYVPIIIKGLSYSMHIFMLRDCPTATVSECLNLSSRMMKGHKGELFMLYLSFIGWLLLAAAMLYLPMFFMRGSVLMMVLGTLAYAVFLCSFLSPYMLTTLAGFYDELKKVSVASGVVSVAEFGPDAEYRLPERAEETLP